MSDVIQSKVIDFAEEKNGERISYGLNFIIRLHGGSIGFQNKKIPNYEIWYHKKNTSSYLTWLSEIIKESDKKIKNKTLREDKEFYILLMAHLTAYCIAEKIEKRDVDIANFLKEKALEHLIMLIYIEILGEPFEKFQYLGKIWTEDEINTAYTKYKESKPTSDLNIIKVYDEPLMLRYETIFTNIITISGQKPEHIKFQNKEMPNYDIDFIQYYSIQDYGTYLRDTKIATVKEVIKEADKRIKKKFKKEEKEFYTLILAHLMAHYLKDKMKKLNLQVYTWNHKKLTEYAYESILGEPKEKFLYLGDVWNEDEIDAAYIKYRTSKSMPDSQ
jgi:hypothetical protein